jgi:AcrR family transcriptional regulator
MVAQSEKRDSILDAALELFVERGFHGTSVPLIADRARVGAGTIYRYFESKEALVNALFCQWKSALMEYLLEGFPFDAPPREQLHVYCTRVNQFTFEHPEAMAFLELHHHASYIDEKSQQVETAYLAAAREVVETWRKAQVVKDLDPGMLMALIWGGLTGVHKAAWMGWIHLDEARLAAAEECLWEAIRR